MRKIAAMNIQIKELLKQVSLKVFIVVCLFLLSLFAFGFIADEAVLENEDRFDFLASKFIREHSAPWLVDFMTAFTNLGSTYFLLPAYIILVAYFLIRKKFKYAVNIAVISLSSFLLMEGLKQFFKRKRPDLPIVKGITSYSFPSGHALSSFVFYSILTYLIWQANIKKGWKLLISFILMLFAIMIGISRIILNVHYATDVIAGFCLGLMWVILSFFILRKIDYDF